MKTRNEMRKKLPFLHYSTNSTNKNLPTQQYKKLLFEKGQTTSDITHLEPVFKLIS